MFCVFCISFLFFLLSHSWWFLLSSAVTWKGDILFLTPLICILLPPVNVLICLCAGFLSRFAYLNLVLLIPFGGGDILWEWFNGPVVTFFFAHSGKGVPVFCVTGAGELKATPRGAQCLWEEGTIQALARGDVCLVMVRGKAGSHHPQAGRAPGKGVLTLGWDKQPAWPGRRWQGWALCRERVPGSEDLVWPVLALA